VNTDIRVYVNTDIRVYVNTDIRVYVNTGMVQFFRVQFSSVIVT